MGGEQTMHVTFSEITGLLFFAGFLFMVGYFAFKLWIWPAEEPQIDPERVFIINGEEYKFIKVSKAKAKEDHDVAS